MTAAPPSRRDGGRTWSTLDNQPTAQFYRVVLDQDFPYNIYGAQQITRPFARPVVTAGNHLSLRRIGTTWAAARAAGSAPDPRNSQIVYAGSYDGLLTRQDKRHRPEPQHQCLARQHDGLTAWRAMKYRFQWSFPIVFSPHDSKTL